MSKIIVEIKECSMYDVYKLIEQIKRNKYVEDAYHVSSIFDDSIPVRFAGKCLCPPDGIYPDCPVHGRNKR